MSDCKIFMKVQIYEQAYAKRCYGIVIVVGGQEFLSLREQEFQPDANCNYLPLPKAKAKAIQIAKALGQKIVEIHTSRKIKSGMQDGIKFKTC